jgi:hypothetical protein
MPPMRDKTCPRRWRPSVIKALVLPAMLGRQDERQTVSNKTVYLIVFVLLAVFWVAVIKNMWGQE